MPLTWVYKLSLKQMTKNEIAVVLDLKNAVHQLDREYMTSPQSAIALCEYIYSHNLAKITDDLVYDITEFLDPILFGEYPLRLKRAVLVVYAIIKLHLRERGGEEITIGIGYARREAGVPRILAGSQLAAAASHSPRMSRLFACL